MGTTIYYRGIATSREKLIEMIDLAESHSKSLNWKVEKISDKDFYGLTICPHEKCETVSLVFDLELKFSSFTKTVYAPLEIHREIIKLIYSIKKYFKELTVLDESGFWDEYVETQEQTKNLDALRLYQLNHNQIQELEEGFINDEDSDDNAKWFWGFNKSYGKLDFPTIRDLMRKDLSIDRLRLITLTEVIKISRDDKISNFVSPAVPEMALILLVEAWLRMSTENNLTPIDCSVLAWIVAYGCFGFDGGYLNNFHQKSLKLYEKLIEETKSTLNS
ncbi:MAG TPA: hypothetical protein VF941_01380, partial [Clostridia bacterium]